MIKATTRETFENDVLKASRPVLLDVWAPFCGPCRSLEPVVEELAEELKDIADVVKLDASLDMEFVQELGVSGLPTFLVYKNGEVVAQDVGALGKDKLKSLVLSAV